MGSLKVSAAGWLDLRALSWAFLVLALALGIYARFAGLHLWSVALDEYHSIMAVRFILENGVPSFPDGGYYMRGVLPSYLAAGLTSFGFLGETTAFRLISAIASLAAVPPLFFLARAAAGTNAACVVAGLFLLSVLEIETARYARMYGPFQALFLWHLWFLLQALREPANRRYIVGMIALAAVGPFVFEGAIFLVLLFFVPVLARPAFYRWPYLAIGFVLFIGTFLYESIGWRRLGVSYSPVPEVGASAGGGPPAFGPLLLPDLTVLGLPAAVYWLCGLAGVLLGGALVAHAVRRESSPWTLGLVAAVALPLAFMHQIAVAGLIVVFVLFFALGTERGEVHSLLRRIAAICAIAAVCWAGALVVVGPGARSAGGFVRTAYDVLGAYPPLLDTFVRPWLDQQPVSSLLLGGLGAAGAAAAVLSPRLRRGNPVYFLLLAVFVALLAVVAAINTPYTHSRYSLFLYPVWIILALMPLAWLYAWISETAGRRVASAGAVISLVAALVVSDDISFAHITSVDSYESAYRLTPASARQRDRLDYESVARFVNERVPAEATVISTERKVAFYTDKIDLTFFDSSSPEFGTTTAVGGARELWTGLPVVATTEALWRAIEEMPAPAFVIYRGNQYDYPNDTEVALSERDGEVVFRSPDGSMVVKRIE